MGIKSPAYTHQSEALSQSVQKSSCGTEDVLHTGGSFFLYEKSVLRESDFLRGRRKEVCTDLTPLFFRP